MDFGTPEIPEDQPEPVSQGDQGGAADNLDWPTLALGTVGAEFEVLRPPELVEHIREWGARFTRSTGP